jgi:hypothetical protein
MLKNMLLAIVVFTKVRGMVSTPEIPMSVGKSFRGNVSVNKKQNAVADGWSRHP